MKHQDVFLDQSQLNALAPELQQYLAAEHDAELGGLEAQALLVHIASRIGPLIYNRALADAGNALESRMATLQEALWELERS